VKKSEEGCGWRKEEARAEGSPADFCLVLCLETSCSSAVYVERPDEMIDLLPLRDLVRAY